MNSPRNANSPSNRFLYAFLVSALLSGCLTSTKPATQTGAAADEVIPTEMVTLDVAIAGVGNVASNPSGIDCNQSCSADFASGSTVSLSATPDAGYRFEKWGGSCQGSGKCAVVLSQASNITAEFMAEAETPPTEPEPEPDPPVSEFTVTSQELFVLPASDDFVPIFLHPGPTVQSGSELRVAFGIPLPRKLVSDVSEIKIADVSGNELASHIEELTRWRSLSGDASVDSVRAAVVYLDITFAELAPMTVLVHWGATRNLELGPQPPVRETWVPISQGPFPDEYPVEEDIMEPAVYATLPPDWMSICLLRTRTDAAFSNPDWQWYDQALVNFADTAVNDVSDYVTEENRIDYVNQYEPWLFDRALTLFGVYARTGDLKWLRHAHRAAQFYAKKVTPGGGFELKGWDDLKYSYGQSMLLDLQLTGDTSLTAPIERVAANAMTWPVTYSTTLNFWTERHHTYAFLGVLSAWEATGNSTYANHVSEMASATFSHALNPPDGWTPDGSLLHTVRQHEGNDSDVPIASPWMSALFADAIWQYYLHSENPEALTFLANLGGYIKNHAIYIPSSNGPYPNDIHLFGYSLPWYLASSVHESSSNGPYGDIEHTCDVAGLTSKAAWATQQLGNDPTPLTQTTAELLRSCQTNLANWYRPDSDVNYGKSPWRLAPPRKFSWWFGSSFDINWMNN